MVDVTCIAKDYKTKKNDAGVTVRIYEGTSVAFSGVTGSNGIATFKVPAEKVYKVEYSKAGKVTRFVMLNAKKIDIELLQGAASPLMKVEIALFEEVPNIDYSYIKNNPITEFYFDGKNPQLAFDEVVADRVMKKTEAILAEAEKKSGGADAQYQAVIKLADGLAGQKKYQEAINKYEEAYNFKKGDKYATEQIVKLESLLQAQKVSQLDGNLLDDEYANLIKAADMLRDQKKYQAAIDKYEEARKKKDEQYPRDEIKELEYALIKQKKDAESEAAYTAAIAAGDGFMKQKSYKAAKDQYSAALKAREKDEYATRQLAAIDGFLNKEKNEQEKKKKYEEAIAAGELLIASESWTEAKAKFNEALTYESAATYPNEKIKIIDAKLAEIEKEKLKQEKLKNLLSEGAAAMKAQQWEAAKGKYTEALTLDDKNAEATTNLASINAKLEEIKNANAQQQKFMQLVVDGDGLAGQKKYQEALAKYQEAIGIKPDMMVDQKITDLKKQISDLAAEKDKKEKYDLAMKDGEALLLANKLEEAKIKFTEASTIDDKQQLPKDKIKQIDAKLLADANSKQKKEKYDAAMAAGEELMAAAKWQDAKVKFTEASTIDDKQQLPKDKIKQVDAKLLQESQAKEKSYKYDNLMKAAEELYLAGKLVEARAKYTDARILDNTQILPEQKIQQIDAELASAADAKARKEKAAKYEEAIKAAGALYDAGKLSEAKSKYYEAKNIDNTQTFPDEQITKIEGEMGKQAADADRKKKIETLMKEGLDLMIKKEYANARNKFQEVLAIDELHKEASLKSAEATQYLNDMASQKEKDLQFSQLKAKGMDAFNQKKWESARQDLKAARDIKADAEIDKKLQEIDGKIAAELASQSNDQVYDALIKDAASLEAAKNLEEAIKKYQEASSKKPEEKLPQEKIKTLQAQLNAQAEIDRKYNAVMSKADDAFKAENYVDAIKLYNEALSIKTSQEPVDKAAKAQQLEEAKNSDFKKNYEKILEAGQKAMDEKNWDKATDLYKRALDIKKNDPLPKTQLEAIENFRKAEEDQNKALAEKNRNYTNKMNEAEAAAKLNEYDKAILLFEQARLLKPEDKTAENRISELNKKKASAENANQQEKLYKGFMAAAESAFKAKDYPKALAEYKNAINVKKDDKAASDGISEIQQILDDLANAEKQNQKDAQFDEFIKKGDLLFKNKNWAEAQLAYEAAQAIRPDNYAKEQVKKCIANENSKTAEAAKYNKIIADADISFNAADYTKAKELYNKALDLKKNDPYPQTKLEQIENILHPKIVQTGPLPNLGAPTDNSVLEGQALLTKAEEQRKNRRGTSVSGKIYEQKVIEDERTSKKNKSILDVASDLLQKEKERTMASLDDDADRQATINKVKEDAAVIAQKREEADVFEYAESTGTTEKMALARSEMAKEYAASHGVYAENAGMVKSKRFNLEDDLYEKSGKVYDERLEAEHKLNQVVITVANNAYDDTESRKITEVDVEKARTTVIAADAQKQLEKVASTQQNVDHIGKNNTLKALQDAEDMKLAAENKEKVNVIDNKAAEMNFEATQGNIEEIYQTDNKISVQKVELSKAYDKKDEDRLASVEILKKGSSELDERQRNEFNALYVKTLVHQQNIETEKQRGDDVEVLRSEAQKQDLAVITSIDQKTVDRRAEQSMSDDLQRLATKEKMAADEIVIAAAASKDAQKSSDNKQKLETTVAKLNEKDELENKAQVTKNYDARKMIEKIESKEVKFDDKLANEIGKGYPEGVSQESFNQNGSDGLPVAVLTRRIVVKNGNGQVYVRKQTLSGITYSKNGFPSSEHVWQSETQDASLIKNY